MEHDQTHNAPIWSVSRSHPASARRSARRNVLQYGCFRGGAPVYLRKSRAECFARARLLQYRRGSFQKFQLDRALQTSVPSGIFQYLQQLEFQYSGQHAGRCDIWFDNQYVRFTAADTICSEIAFLSARSHSSFFQAFLLGQQPGPDPRSGCCPQRLSRPGNSPKQNRYTKSLLRSDPTQRSISVWVLSAICRTSSVRRQKPFARH